MFARVGVGEHKVRPYSNAFADESGRVSDQAMAQQLWGMAQVVPQKILAPLRLCVFA
ncbi:MAG: hypothetical protein AB1424_17470 [Thermodesulfobacteriota bacterium]